MPHALSLPFTALLSPASASDPAAGRPYTAFLPVEQLRTVLIRALASPRAVLDLSVPRGGLTAEELALGERRWEEVVTGARGVTWSCGSGMTAAVGIWAMRLVAAAEGREALENVALYDEVSLSPPARPLASSRALIWPSAVMGRVCDERVQRDRQGVKG